MDLLHQLHQEVRGEEFDYTFLLSHLQKYSKPRDKITRLLKNNDIIRIKKGLYVFGERYRKGLVSLEVLANLIYGPSYISFEYALSYYGMIPERVSEITCVTTHKNKLFNTPLGYFSYRHLPLKKYEIGISQQCVEADRCFLMATKEKALADIVGRQKGFKTEKDLSEYLIQGLRIEERELSKLNKTMMSAIANGYNQDSVYLLSKLIKG